MRRKSAVECADNLQEGKSADAKRKKITTVAEAELTRRLWLLFHCPVFMKFLCISINRPVAEVSFHSASSSFILHFITLLSLHQPCLARGKIHVLLLGKCTCHGAQCLHMGKVSTLCKLIALCRYYILYINCTKLSTLHCSKFGFLWV